MGKRGGEEEDSSLGERDEKEEGIDKMNAMEKMRGKERWKT